MKMSASLKTPMAIAFALAASLLALPALSAPSHATGPRPAQHRVADFAEATAYVSPATPIAQAPETDGLSRKDDECNFGCIDH
jgi:hypothetical protein